MPDELDPSVWVERAREAGEAKDYDQALDASGGAIELDPNNAVAWLNRGVALWYLDRREEAAAAYRQAVELDTALERIGSRDEAAAAYDRACELGWRRYRVEIRGENYLMESGRPGLYTSRFGVATSRELAMSRAAQMIRDDSDL